MLHGAFQERRGRSEQLLCRGRQTLLLVTFPGHLCQYRRLSVRVRVRIRVCFEPKRHTAGAASMQVAETRSTGIPFPDRQGTHREQRFFIYCTKLRTFRNSYFLIRARQVYSGIAVALAYVHCLNLNSTVFARGGGGSSGGGSSSGG